MKILILLLLGLSSCGKPKLETPKPTTSNNIERSGLPTSPTSPTNANALPNRPPAATTVLDKTPYPGLQTIPAAAAKAGWVVTEIIANPLLALGKPANNLELITAVKTINGIDRSISVVHGDLLAENVEAIVNAANISLTGGSGIDGAIHDAAKVNSVDIMQQEGIDYKKFHNIAAFPVGSAMVMNPYGLKSKFKLVVFTVGPELAGDGAVPTELQKQQLYSAIYNSMLKANEYQIKSLASVLVSTGVFYFPEDIASELHLKAALQFFADYPQSTLIELRLTNFDKVTPENLAKNKNTSLAVFQGFKKIFK